MHASLTVVVFNQFMGIRFEVLHFKRFWRSWCLPSNKMNQWNLTVSVSKGEPVDDQVDGPARLQCKNLNGFAYQPITERHHKWRKQLSIWIDCWGTEGKKKTPSGIGVTYTRLGSDSCRSGAELVYEGVVAGSLYNQKGGSSNYLCLPEDPEYSTTFKSGVQGDNTLWNWILY